jgi:hypothetical protein
MSSRSRKILFRESRALPVRRADNLTANCEPVVWTSGYQTVILVPLGVHENNIGNGGKHKKKKGVEIKTQKKVMKF